MTNEKARQPGIDQLTRAIQFALVAVVFGFSCFPIVCSLHVHTLREVIYGMGIRPPGVTSLVLNARSAFITLSFLLPLAAIATIFVRNVVTSFYLLACIVILVAVNFLILYSAFTEPFFRISESLGH